MVYIERKFGGRNLIVLKMIQFLLKTEVMDHDYRRSLLWIKSRLERNIER